MRTCRVLVTVVSSVLVSGCGVDEDQACTGDGCDAPVEEALVLRDDYGIPHIFAETRRAASYGWGWTDAEDMRDELVGLAYGGAGRAREKLGPDCGTTCLEGDLRVQLYRVVEAVERGYPQLAPETREALEAYADGANAHFRQLDPPARFWDGTTPLTAQMLAGAIIMRRIEHARAATQADIDPGGGASNQFAVSGERTEPDTTLALKDPHNQWTTTERYIHLQIAGVDFVGNGWPANVGCGASSYLAFGCTRASPASAVTVEARVSYLGENAGNAECGGYPELAYYDHLAGDFVPFEMRCLGVGDYHAWAYDSRFGPLEAVGPDIDMNGVADTVFMVQVFAANDPTIVDYQLGRMLAQSADELVGMYAAPTPREDAQYRSFATRDHQIGLVLGASTPALDPALDWTQPVSSDDARIDGWTSDADWSNYRAASWYNVDGQGPELPHVIDPVGGMVQNCNGNPAFATEPPDQVGTVPSILESYQGTSIRGERLRALLSAQSLDATDALAIAGDVKVVYGERLAEAVRCRVTMDAVDPVASWGDGGTLMQQLLDWSAEDYQALPESTATTVMFLLDAASSDPTYPAAGACSTAAELDALGVALRDTVAPYMKASYGSQPDPLRVPWGYVNYTVVGGREVGLPGAGGRLATLFVSHIALGDDGRARQDVHVGSRVPQVTAYRGGTLDTWIVSPHGQIDERVFAGSPHVGQSIDAFAARQLRRVPLTQQEVEATLCPWGDPDSPEFDPAHEHRSRVALAVPR